MKRIILIFISLLLLFSCERNKQPDKLILNKDNIVPVNFDLKNDLKKDERHIAPFLIKQNMIYIYCNIEDIDNVAINYLKKVNTPPSKDSLVVKFELEREFVNESDVEYILNKYCMVKKYSSGLEETIIRPNLLMNTKWNVIYFLVKKGFHYRKDCLTGFDIIWI